MAAAVEEAMAEVARTAVLRAGLEGLAGLAA